MERKPACRAEDGLSEPAQTEQHKKDAKRDLEHRERDAEERPAEQSDDRQQERDRGSAARQSRSPAADAAHSEHNGERLHALDQRGEERGHKSGKRR